MALPPFIQQSGIIGAFLFGKKGLVALASVSLFVDKVQDLIKESKVRMGIFDMDNLKEVTLAVDTISNQVSELELQKSLLGDIDTPNIDKKLKSLRTELEMLEERRKILEHSANIRKFEAFEHQKELHKGLKTHKEINAELEKRMENTSRENGLIRNQNQHIETLMDKIKNLNEKSLRNVESKFKNIKGTISEGINNGITTMSQGLARAFVFGEKLSDTLRNMAQKFLANIISALIEVVARKGVELAIEKMITNEKKKQAMLSSVSGGGSIFITIGSFFGKKASGGAVSKGQPYMVGEQGAEMFIPNSSGQITQSARGTGGGSTTVNFNINTVDASGFEELLVRSRGTITQLINSAVNERGSKNLI
jgi:hypothetical protein